MLVAAVLDLEPAAGPPPLPPPPRAGGGDGGEGPVPAGWRHCNGSRPPAAARTPGKRGKATAGAVACRSAADDHRRAPGAAEAPDVVSQLGLGLARHGAGIDDGEIRVCGGWDRDGALVGERLTYHLRVVLVRLAAEGVEINF